MRSNLFQQKHELWLTLLFGAFSVKDEAIFDLLYDFAMIEYRHLVWLGDTLVEEGEAFDYDKGEISFQAEDNFALFHKLITACKEIEHAYHDNSMFARFRSDESYFIQKLGFLLADSTNNAPITAFDKKRSMEGYDLNQSQTDALTLFLFEESYKEYELILVYTYSNFYTDSKLLSSIFSDLIYESHFHLKSFARMMCKMGLLSIPRTLSKRVYQFDDLEQFLKDGIKEEEAAKEECLKLAAEVEHPELSAFFNFINYQENYHIALMEKALRYLEEKR
jgi:rubrerythrin